MMVCFFTWTKTEIGKRRNSMSKNTTPHSPDASSDALASAKRQFKFALTCNAMEGKDQHIKDGLFFLGKISQPSAAPAANGEVRRAAIAIYQNNPATSSGRPMSWEDCAKVFPERIVECIADAEAALASLPRAPQVGVDIDTQYAWLIEKAGTYPIEYLYYGAGFEFTTDAYKALWFIRRSDADTVASESLDDLRVVEHGFDITGRSSFKRIRQFDRAMLLNALHDVAKQYEPRTSDYLIQRFVDRIQHELKPAPHPHDAPAPSAAEPAVDVAMIEAILDEHDLNVPDGLLSSPAGFGAHREALTKALQKCLPHPAPSPQPAITQGDSADAVIRAEDLEDIIVQYKKQEVAREFPDATVVPSDQHHRMTAKPLAQAIIAALEARSKQQEA
jgi:hypothetical protein